MPSRPEFPVYDQHGRTIGHVRKSHPGRSGREFWAAVSLDGCDLGTRPGRADAEWAIVEDWDAGRPRSSRDRRERWRPLWDGAAVYLGNG